MNERGYNMRTVAIISDSTCDLSAELLEKYKITTFPLHIHLGEDEYSDGVNITPEQIYEWSDANKATPKTSALSPFEAKECLEKQLLTHKEVICFCISEDMSSCASVMRMAANELEAEERVFVIDSRNLSTGIGLQIIEAAILAEQGKTAQEIKEHILSLQPFVRASFVVDTLTYLYRGGRCSGVAAFAGSTLKLHPYISVVDGKMQPGKKYRGKMDKVIREYVEDLKNELKTANKERVFITHSGCEQSIIDMVRNQLEEMGWFEEILITRAGSVITSHCGPGTLGVLFIAGKE
ncbi:MAG: DegV family protein [Lachnospiraceae bacterium]|nr:DegV family protein [Lachnospiraceae bacterium]